MPIAPAIRATCETYGFIKVLAQAYGALPSSVRKLADANFKLLKNDPHHPSLQFKRVGRFWSARVGLCYRALAVETEGVYVWFWIGSHADYDRLVG